MRPLVESGHSSGSVPYFQPELYYIGVRFGDLIISYVFLLLCRYRDRDRYAMCGQVSRSITAQVQTGMYKFLITFAQDYLPGSL